MLKYINERVDNIHKQMENLRDKNYKNEPNVNARNKKDGIKLEKNIYMGLTADWTQKRKESVLLKTFKINYPN